MANKILITTLFIIIISGCATKPDLSLYKKINVPEKYQDGRCIPYETSPYEYYLSAYEKNYWDCVKNRAKNIDYKYTSDDFVGNGWSSSIAGYKDGYMDAETKINDLVKYYGKQKVQKFLRDNIGYDYIKK